MKKLKAVQKVQELHPVEKIENVKKVGRFIPKKVSRTVGRTLLKTQKHSPTILFVGGVVGVVATTVLACRATLKLEEVLEESTNNMDKARLLRDSKHEKYSEHDYKKDITILYVQSAVKITKLYGPALLLGAASIGALTGAHNILSTRNAGLTAAYAAVDKGFREYRERVVSEFGEEKDQELRYGTEEVTLVEEKKSGEMKKVHVKRVDGRKMPSQYAVFFDKLCLDWSSDPEYNRIFLQCKQQYANNTLQARGHIFLNEIYDAIGVPRTKAGAVVGWALDANSDNFVDFGIFSRGDDYKVRDFVNGHENSILLDFNVDGVILDKI